MYLENDDLCKRIIEKGEKIFILPKSKVTHLGAKAVDPKYNYEVEISRNWHWMWSKFYFNRKHYGFFQAFFSILPSFISSIIKIFIFTLLFNKQKRKIYQFRFSGILNSIIGRSSWYRIKD